MILVCLLSNFQQLESNMEITAYFPYSNLEISENLGDMREKDEERLLQDINSKEN